MEFYCPNEKNKWQWTSWKSLDVWFWSLIRWLAQVKRHSPHRTWWKDPISYALGQATGRSCIISNNIFVWEILNVHVLLWSWVQMSISRSVINVQILANGVRHPHALQRTQIKAKTHQTNWHTNQQPRFPPPPWKPGRGKKGGAQRAATDTRRSDLMGLRFLDLKFFGANGMWTQCSSRSSSYQRWKEKRDQWHGKGSDSKSTSRWFFVVIESW